MKYNRKEVIIMDNTLSFMFGMFIATMLLLLVLVVSGSPIRRYNDTLLNCEQPSIRAMEDPDVDGRLVFYCENNKVVEEE